MWCCSEQARYTWQTGWFPLCFTLQSLGTCTDNYSPTRVDGCRESPPTYMRRRLRHIPHNRTSCYQNFTHIEYIWLREVNKAETCVGRHHSPPPILPTRKQPTRSHCACTIYDIANSLIAINHYFFIAHLLQFSNDDLSCLFRIRSPRLVVICADREYYYYQKVIRKSNFLFQCPPIQPAR